MQFGNAKPPLGVVFDCDMGESIDDALALAVLYGLDGKNECRVVAVSTTNPTLASAAFCEVVGRFYAGAVSAQFMASGRTLPVGMATSGIPQMETPMLTAPLSRKGADGAPVYPHGIQKLVDTADPAAVVRNAFTAQHDQNAGMVLAGPAVTLAAALALPGVKDLIARKARHLVAVERGLVAHPASAQILFAEWPGTIFVVPESMGAKYKFPASAIETAFSWNPNHPVVDAFRAAGNKDAPAAGVLAALHCVRAEKKYFGASAAGTFELGANGKLALKPSAEGRHHWLEPDPAQSEAVMAAMVELASAKPVVRQRFRPRPAEQQVAPPKPQEAKPATP
jgi:predicted phage tail protein